jgi:hypothetical protein
MERGSVMYVYCSSAGVVRLRPYLYAVGVHVRVEMVYCQLKRRQLPVTVEPVDTKTGTPGAQPSRCATSALAATAVTF